MYSFLYIYIDTSIPLLYSTHSYSIIFFQWLIPTHLNIGKYIWTIWLFKNSLVHCQVAGFASLPPVPSWKRWPNGPMAHGWKTMRHCHRKYRHLRGWPHSFFFWVIPTLTHCIHLYTLFWHSFWHAIWTCKFWHPFWHLFWDSLYGNCRTSTASVGQGMSRSESWESRDPHLPGKNATTNIWIFRLYQHLLSFTLILLGWTPTDDSPVLAAVRASSNSCCSRSFSVASARWDDCPQYLGRRGDTGGIQSPYGHLKGGKHRRDKRESLKVAKFQEDEVNAPCSAWKSSNCWFNVGCISHKISTVSQNISRLLFMENQAKSGVPTIVREIAIPRPTNKSTKKGTTCNNIPKWCGIHPV